MSNTNALMNKIINNVEKVIVGKRSTIELLLTSMICGGHVLIEDIPGVGKTSLASAIAKTVNFTFNRIQCTPDTLPSDITGFTMYNQKTGDFQYCQGAIMSNLVLVDEINRTSPKTQSSLLEVMEENQVTVDGKTHSVPNPFMVIGTQNPIEYVGTYSLPEAQIDRFFMKLELGYPSTTEEINILTKYELSNPLSELDSVANCDDIINLQSQVKTVFVDDSLKEYIIKIINSTREEPDVIALGVSPRGSLALFRASQAWALYNGRDYVIPDDIKKMSLPVLSHRIILKPDARLKKVSVTELLAHTIDKIQVPVVR